MNYNDAAIAEITNRINISEIVERYVTLKRQHNEWSGLCPFHKEKTPSFTVNDQKKFYHCFGCGAHGNVFSFLMNIENIKFNIALKKLADEAGVEIKKEDVHYAKERKYSEELIAALELSTKWFSDNLHSDIGRDALQYICNKRKIKKDIVEKFKLGFAPDNRQALYKFLKSQNIADQVMIDAGLITKRDDRVFDRFNSRLMFPILNRDGNVIAFGGRSLRDAKSTPKYLNSPETQLFKKGSVLYADPAIYRRQRDAEKLCVVEGYMDVIALHQSGMPNVTATLGTAVTVEHVKMMWNMNNEPLMIFDGDGAGKRAAERMIEVSMPDLKPNYSFQFCFLPHGEDPYDIAMKRDIESYIKKSKSFSEFLWDVVVSKNAGNAQHTPEKYAGIEAQCMNYASAIKHEKVKSFYFRFFRNKLFELSRSCRRPYNRNIVEYDEYETNISNARYINEIILMNAVLKFPDILDCSYIEEDFFEMHFANEVCAYVQNELINNNDREYISILHEKFISRINSNDLDKLLLRHDIFSKKDALIIWKKAMCNILNTKMHDEYVLHIRNAYGFLNADCDAERMLLLRDLHCLYGI